MTGNRRHKCPYCGKKMGYFSSIINKSEGEYTCKHCNRHSNIEYSSGIYAAFCIACIVSLYLAFFAFKETYQGILMAFVPFGLFYLCVPAFSKLVSVKSQQRGLKYEDLSSGRTDMPVSFNRTQNNSVTGNKINGSNSSYDVINSENTGLNNDIKSDAIAKNIQEIMNRKNNEESDNAENQEKLIKSNGKSDGNESFSSSKDELLKRNPEINRTEKFRGHSNVYEAKQSVFNINAPKRETFVINFDDDDELREEKKKENFRHIDNENWEKYSLYDETEPDIKTYIPKNKNINN